MFFNELILNVYNEFVLFIITISKSDSASIP